MEKSASEYYSRFSHHMSDYQRLMINDPFVRLNEFKALRDIAKLTNPMKILEFSADGLYLEKMYPSSMIDRVDIVDIDRTVLPDVRKTSWAFENVASYQYDAVLSVVPLHHANQEEKNCFLKNACRVLNTNGVLAIAEVEAGSAVARFLDDFVSNNSSSSHVGNYLNLSFVDEMAIYFDDASVQHKKINWVFRDQEHLKFFMTSMFRLKYISDSNFMENLQEYFLIKKVNHKFYLEWPLIYFYGKRA